MQNIFRRGLPIPDALSKPDMKYEESLEISSIEPPYFALLSFKHKRNDPFGLGGFSGLHKLFEPITDKGYRKFDLYVEVPDEKQRRPYEEELEFMVAMDLAIKRMEEDGKDNNERPKKKPVYYINRFARILYDSKHGLFINLRKANSDDDIKRVVGPFMRLCLTYLLPGRYWRCFYARQYLSKTIADATQLDQQMLEIEDEWLDIHRRFRLPDPTQKTEGIVDEPAA